MADVVDVLLVVPSASSRLRAGESLGVGYLASSLAEAGISVAVIDCPAEGIDINTATHRVLSSAPRLLGISLQHRHSISGARELVRLVRETGHPCQVIVGGTFASFEAERLLNEEDWLDAVFMHEAELGFTALAHAFLQGDGQRLPIEDPHPEERRFWVVSPRCYEGKVSRHIDALPFPARGHWSLIEGDAHAEIVASRGCPLTCTFCSVAALKTTARPRRRSPEDVLAEIDALIAGFGIQAVSFMDDWFPLSGAWIDSLSLGLKERHLHWGCSSTVSQVRAASLVELRNRGLKHVFVGIESFVPRQLSLYGKTHTPDAGEEAVRGLQAIELDVTVGFIPFDPYVQLRELQHNIEVLSALGHCTYAALTNRIAAYRGSQLHSEWMHTGLLVQGPEYSYLWEYEDEDATAIHGAFLGGLPLARKAEQRLMRRRFAGDDDGPVPRGRPEFDLSTRLGELALDAIQQIERGDESDLIADTLRRKVSPIVERIETVG